MARSQLIVQRDQKLLITPGQGRQEIVNVVRWCAELKAIVAGNYVYEVSMIALWGAAARGVTTERLLNALDRFLVTPLPVSFVARISAMLGRYGTVSLVERESGGLRLRATDPQVLDGLGLDLERDGLDLIVPRNKASEVKIQAIQSGWPVVDLVPALGGANLPITIDPSVILRAYQREAIQAFVQTPGGLVLLPCGAGKTIVGVAATASIQRTTLVLVPSQSVGQQWRDAFLALTSLEESQVALASRSVDPAVVTIATYHSATGGTLAGRLVDRPWGLVIYDEVQSLPASVFRLAAALQSARKLGLTATLVREDGRESEIFGLVGPLIYDISWLELEYQGWIAPARCVEIRIPEANSKRDWLRYRLAIVRRLLRRHSGDATLVVGTDLDSLKAAARQFELPLITGNVRQDTRKQLYESFRDGRVKTLAMSRVGSVGVDLPSASVMIQISGTFGSRQEETQRLGRLLRPATGKVAHFYTLVAENTREEEFARRRQRYLVDQGYQYEIIAAADVPRET